MIRIRNFLALVAVLAGAAILGVPASWADFKIFLQEAGVNGSAITEVASGADFSSINFTGPYGDFTVKVFSGASDNGATLSDLLSSTTSVTNNSSASKTLKLYVSETNYSLPAGSQLTVESGLGGSVNKGTTIGLTGIFQAFADKNNNLLGMADFTNGPQTASQTGTTFDTGSATGSFTRNATLYSLTTVVTLTTSGKGVVNYSDHENVTPTPAPSGWVLAASCVPALGLFWLRRRKVKVQNS